MGKVAEGLPGRASSIAPDKSCLSMATKKALLALFLRLVLLCELHVSQKELMPCLYLFASPQS